jgi:Leucine-rich repeat (LRR) protein
MKKLLYTLLAVSIIFSTCKKEEDDDPIINNTPSIEQIIVDKIWKGRVPDFQNNNWNDIIFELRSNDSLYTYTSGCLQTTTNIGTWNISEKIITYNQVINNIEYLNMPFGELTEYSDTQLKFKLDSNVNAICEIYNISTQNCTYIPDYYFEQSLIQLGYDNIMDNFVLTSNIDHIESLVVNSYNIYNLTGIEDFTALTSLHCIDNQLTSLDVSNNTNLTELACSYNQLTSLDLRNGNNTNMYAFYSNNNPYLTCISVDDAAWSTTNWWNIDAQSYFSEDCN